MSVRRNHIRTLTLDLLKRGNVRAAPVPVDKIAKALGIIVKCEVMEDDTEMSGFLFRDERNGRAIIGVNRSNSKARRRFTIAHELGHFLLHPGNSLHIDRRFRVNLRNQKSSEGTDREEKEANLFAAELLMPEQFLKQDIEELAGIDLDDEGSVEELANRYGVSQQALVFRLNYLGYVEQ